MGLSPPRLAHLFFATWSDFREVPQRTPSSHSIGDLASANHPCVINDSALSIVFVNRATSWGTLTNMFNYSRYTFFKIWGTFRRSATTPHRSIADGAYRFKLNFRRLPNISKEVNREGVGGFVFILIDDGDFRQLVGILGKRN